MYNYSFYMVELSFGKKYWIERDLQPNLGVSMLGWAFLQRTHSFQAFTAYSCCSVERLERLFNADLTGTTAALLWPYTTTKTIHKNINQENCFQQF